MSSLTHGSDDLGVSHVVDNDLAHLGEVPSVPFLKKSRRAESASSSPVRNLSILKATGTKVSLCVAHLDSHRVNVDLLVEVVEEGNGLDDHGVDLVGRELELEPDRKGQDRGNQEQLFFCQLGL